MAVTLAEIEKVTKKVSEYDEEIAKLLAEVRSNEEEKQLLRQALDDVYAFLKTSKLANVELANEVAELLVLANIPNSKKDELYARHLAAVNAIAEAEKTEVKEDDGKEA
jgi:type IV secretory pathway TrbF-like protein